MMTKEKERMTKVRVKMTRERANIIPSVVGQKSEGPRTLLEDEGGKFCIRLR